MKIDKMLSQQMFRILTFSLLLNTALASTCKEADDISPCTCSDTNNIIEVNCSDLGLSSIPDNLPKQTSVLDFSNNLLQPGNVKYICKYRSLQHVSIAGNGLTSIRPRSLRTCGSLKSFNFSGNVFDSVTKYTLYGLEFMPVLSDLEARDFHENTFEDMLSLKELGIVLYQSSLPGHLFKGRHIRILTISIYGANRVPATFLTPLAPTLTDLTLRSTSIQRVPEMLFSEFKTLRTCNLYVTDVHTIPSKLFQTPALYRTLENISLSGIKSLPRYVFWSLGAMRHLEIHGAEDIPSDLFYGLLGLKSLDLSSSALSVLPDEWFVDLWSLKELNLRNVSITVVKKDDFLGLQSLETLDLSDNDLQILSTGLFYETSASVKFIDISKNTLKTVPSNLFKEHSVLECLDISRNQISSIENGAFYHLSQLTRLYLQNNKLNDLEAATFIHNVNMAYLDMSSNELIDLPGELFEGTHKLSFLNLSNNGIHNLERSIKFNIPTLSEINLSSNPIECNCGTLAVKKSLSKVSIIGDCEKPQPGIAIVDFVPDTNCILQSDTELFGTKFTSLTVFLYPSESEKDVRASASMISTNDVVSKSVREYKPTEIVTTTGNVLYSSHKLSDFWMNNFTNSNYPSNEINDLTVTVSELNVSEFNNVATLITTPTPSYDVDLPIIDKSSVRVNLSKVKSSDRSSDFSIHNLSTLEVNKTQTAGDEIVSELTYFTTPTVDIYRTDNTVSLTGGKSGTLKFERDASSSIWNEGTSYLTFTPTPTLEPSFKTVYTTSRINSGISATGIVSDAVLPTAASQVFSSDDSLTDGYLVSISPSSVAVITEAKDDNKMTEGFHYSPETSLNVTALPPVFELGRSNVTGQPEMAGKDEKGKYFYLSLGSILSVALLSVLILVFLYYKKRRSTQYEVQSRTELDVYNLDHSLLEDDKGTSNSSCPLNMLKDVPSIQIESVDDDGNVRVEMYPISKT